MQIPKNKKFQNLTGRLFGKYVVIEYAGMRWPDNKGSKGFQWLCKCECGKEKIVLGGCLKSGNTQSCGCHHRELMTKRHRNNDLTGKRFGKLIVEKVIGKKHNQILWQCKCDCGNIKNIVAGSLRRGLTKSCGDGECRRHRRYIHGLSGKPGYKKYLLADPTRKMRHYVGSFVAGTLKKRHSEGGKSVWKFLPYTPDQLRLHLERLFEPWMNWDNYGGKANDKRKTWHLDHIIAQDKFPFKFLDDPLFLECWDLSNLRPLEKIENFSKGSI